LLLITDHLTKQHNYLLEPEARDAIGHILAERKSQSEVNFGNAREVRNLFEAIMEAQANRIVSLAKPSRQDLQTIKLDDVVLAIH
jgi:stage V sporulation protein K